jgi:hypothetical protein
MEGYPELPLNTLSLVILHDDARIRLGSALAVRGACALGGGAETVPVAVAGHVARGGVLTRTPIAKQATHEATASIHVCHGWSEATRICGSGNRRSGLPHVEAVLDH